MFSIFVNNVIYICVYYILYLVFLSDFLKIKMRILYKEYLLVQQ